VKLEGRSNALIHQYVLCGDRKSVWGGDEKESNASFVPMTVKGISGKIAEMLK